MCVWEQDKKDYDVMVEEFRCKYHADPDEIDPSERVANLPDPVLYPIVGGSDEGTGIPAFDLVMRVDIQGKFQKEKSVMAFQNNFGDMPPRAMLEITEMVFQSSSLRGQAGSRSQRNVQEVKLQRDIFLPEPRPVQPYSRLKMFRPDEASMEGFQTAGCHSQYYARMMQVLLALPPFFSQAAAPKVCPVP